MIPYGKQDITQSDIDAVTEVLKSDFLTSQNLPSAKPLVVNFLPKFND